MNCQMGRGRTTTGMVASSLVYSLLMTDLVDELDDRGLTQSTVALDAEDEAGEGDTTSRSAWGDDERDEDALLNGDYRVILQLVGVVPQGIVAKRLLDQTIDRMDGVQNLRSAIRDYKLRAEADAGSAKGRKAFSLGCACACRSATDLADSADLFRYGALLSFCVRTRRHPVADVPRPIFSIARAPRNAPSLDKARSRAGCTAGPRFRAC